MPNSWWGLLTLERKARTTVKPARDRSSLRPSTHPSQQYRRERRDGRSARDAAIFRQFLYRWKSELVERRADAALEWGQGKPQQYQQATFHTWHDVARALGGPFGDQQPTMRCPS